MRTLYHVSIHALVADQRSWPNIYQSQAQKQKQRIGAAVCLVFPSHFAFQKMLEKPILSPPIVNTSSWKDLPRTQSWKLDLSSPGLLCTESLSGISRHLQLLYCSRTIHTILILTEMRKQKEQITAKRGLSDIFPFV